MKVFRLFVGSLAVAGATGCLATKGDIRLLQDELRATRSVVARSDSAHKRTSDSLAVALATLRSSQMRTDQALQQSIQQANDALKALTTRVTSIEVANRERFKSIDEDLSQVQELARQSARGSTIARAQQEQAAVVPRPTIVDTTAAASQPTVPAGVAGPATLLLNGRSQIIQGGCVAARRAFQDLLASFPNSLEAAEAQYSIAESYNSCGEGGNPAKADSVYRLVTEKYPRSDFAATSLYKRAEMQRLAGRADLAR